MNRTQCRDSALKTVVVIGVNADFDIDPVTIPYTYGNVYSQNQFYPGQLVQLQHPYIVRDLRGQAVWVFPFQYNPVTKELRVYSEIHFKVKANGTSIFTILLNML